MLALRDKQVAVPWREIPGLTLIGWLGVSVFQMLRANGLALTTASKASVLVAASTIVAVLIAFTGVVILVDGSLSRITIGGGALAFIWRDERLRALGPGRAIVYSCLIAVIAVIASVVLPGEPFGIAHAVGAAVALAGVILARSA